MEYRIQGSCRARKLRFGIAAALLLTSLNPLTSFGFQSTTVSRNDAATDGEDVVPIRIDLTNLMELTGQTIDIRKTDGEYICNVIVTEVKPGEAPESIRALKYREQNSDRQRNLSLRYIDEIFINEHPLDVSYDRRKKSLMHDVEKREQRMELRAEITAALRGTNDKIWEPLLPEDHERFLTMHRDWIESVRERMPDIAFSLVETEYYLFLTNLPANEVNAYIAHLDKMYEVLCAAFNIPPERNIWCGKCVVVAFNEESDYLRFERGIMDVQAMGSQGMCHSYSDGKVVFAGYKGQSGFAHVLVHETSHGFVHRYLTSARLPLWLNEGISDWLAHEIVGGDRITKRRLYSAELVRQNNSLGDFFTTENLSGEMYGAASTLVELLVQADDGDGRFKQYIDDLKRGKAPEEALKDAFGLSYNELEIEYHRLINRP